jgi:hypothetical protein
VRFRGNFHQRWRDPRWFAFWRGFTAFFALFYAVTAYRAGLNNDFFHFDFNALIAGPYVFSCAKSHSAIQRLRRRRRYND